MYAAAIPTDHYRRWRNNFQGKKSPIKQTTHYPQIGKGMNKEETLFSHKA